MYVSLWAKINEYLILGERIGLEVAMQAKPKQIPVTKRRWAVCDWELL